MALTAKIAYRSTEGDFNVTFGQFIFDSSYPSGGYPVDSALVGQYGNLFFALQIDNLDKTGTYLCSWSPYFSFGGWTSDLPPYGPNVGQSLSGQGGGSYSGTATGGASADLPPYPSAQTALKSIILGTIQVFSALGTQVTAASSLANKTINFKSYGK